MSDKLKKGDTIQTKLGITLTVVTHLGEGGQGDVYAVQYNGEQKALKWYKKTGLGENPQSFYDLVDGNREKGAPSSAFLWPMDITEWKNGTFGYIMDLRPKDYFELSEYMLRTVSFPSFKIAIDATLNIVTAFRLLHNKGFSYQDLNDGNFFINPKNGKVLICDNDNVAPAGVETGILGKPGYMAPEIVMCKGKPDKLSDRFSLSVILFILICSNHPLEGKRALEPCLTPALQEKLYGTEALFIMDETNRDNAPDPMIHKNVLAIWSYLPTYLKDIFHLAFSTESLQNPNKRPKELDWIKVLVRFRSEIIACHCGNENFSDNGTLTTCDGCKSTLTSPLKIEFTDYNIPVAKGSRIYRCQIGFCNAEEALEPIASIVAKEDKLGIKNLSDRIWNATTPSGRAKKVQKNEVVPVKENIIIQIDGEDLKITP